MKIFVVNNLIAVIFCAFLLTACSPVVPTEDPALILAKYEALVSRYDKITAGMTSDDIHKVMDTTGSGSDSPGAWATAQNPQSSQLVNWNYEKDGFSVAVTLLNGTISRKVFMWMPETFIPKTNARTTVAKYDLVKFGMTYAEVVSILGSPGVLWTSTERYGLAGAKVDGYIWWPEDEPEISTTHRMLIRFWAGVADQKEFNGVTQTKQ